MPDREEPDLSAADPTGVTTELDVTEVRAGAELAAPAEDLRHHLPGLEPERHVTDWAV